MYHFQDKLMDAYNENGVFPSSLPSKYFEGPIRCHYRPRSFIPMVIYLVWTYFTIPLVTAGLKSIFGTGIMGIFGGLLVLGISKLLSVSPLLVFHEKYTTYPSTFLTIFFKLFFLFDVFFSCFFHL
jgi:hypothetical protein